MTLLIEQKSTVALVLRNGVTVTTGSVLGVEEQEKEFATCRDSNTSLRIVTGDVDKDNDNKPNNAVMIIHPADVMLFTVREFIDEKIAASRHGIVRPSGPIPPQLHRR